MRQVPGPDARRTGVTEADRRARERAREVLARQTAVLIKPNLINADPHPVTTPAACCEAIVNYIRGCSDAEIVIAELDPGMPFTQGQSVVDAQSIDYIIEDGVKPETLRFLIQAK